MKSPLADIAADASAEVPIEQRMIGDHGDCTPGRRLWIDLDNSPHVPLFAPLIKHFRERGHSVFVTARDFAQTLDLVEQLGVVALPVGAHAGRSKVKKLANLPVRALQLVRAVRGFHPDAALSHGSRTQALASRILGVPQVVMFDYEWTELRILSTLATYLICPRALTADRLRAVGVPLRKVTWYDGFKEELYLGDFRPDPGFRSDIGVSFGETLVTIRPPGIIGNYHDSRSEELCAEAIRCVLNTAGSVAVILPKTRLESEFVLSVLPKSPAGRAIIPDRALPGLQLLYASDGAISGGGTMNRESALLGTPTWSIFTGRRALVDEELVRRGLLTFASTIDQVRSITVSRRESRGEGAIVSPKLLYDLSNTIVRLMGVQRV